MRTISQSAEENSLSQLVAVPQKKNQKVNEKNLKELMAKKKEAIVFDSCSVLYH